MEELPSKPIPTEREDDMIADPESSIDVDITLKMVDSHKQLPSENDSGGGGHCLEELVKEGSSSGGDLSELNDQNDSITKGPY